MNTHTLLLAVKITALLSGMLFGADYTHRINIALSLAEAQPQACANPLCDCDPCTCDPCLCGKLSAADTDFWLPYAEAYRRHKETGQTLVVLVTMDGCPPCQAMKDRVFPAVHRSGGFDGVLVARVHYDDDKEFARKLMGSVTRFPLTIIYRCDGGSCSRNATVGQMDVETINRLLKQPATSSRLGYPIRNAWWSGCSSWKHLASGQHRGKFDPTWLASLSNAELQSLHSDDHEGRVKWQYVVRPAAGAVTVSRQTTRRSYCPSCR